MRPPFPRERPGQPDEQGCGESPDGTEVDTEYMCVNHIAVVRIYYFGGRQVVTTANIEKTQRTALEMAEAQREAYEALAENFSAAQRRSTGLANGGIEFAKLQEDNARAAQDWFANGLKLLQLQERNAEFAQDWTDDAVEALREQAEQNLRTGEAFARTIRKQQEGFRSLTQQWVRAYWSFFSPFAYVREGMRITQQATEQVARQGLRVAEEATEQTEEVLRQTEKATREAELRIAVSESLKTANYDELSVDDISKKLNGLATEQLRKVREYEKSNKNRETLIEQIDRKIRANS